jgi:tetratricopeptide (TPR) repeat protein
MGGLTQMEEALQSFAEQNRADWLSTAYSNLSDWMWWTEGPAKGLEAKLEGAKVAEQRGFHQFGVWTRAETVWMLYDLGRWDELVRVSEEVTGTAQAFRGPQLDARVLTYKALVYVHRGKLAEASSLAQQALPLAREIGELQVLVPALAVAARCHAAGGEPAAARALVAELAELSADRTNWRARFLPELVRLVASAGDLAGAQGLMVSEDEVTTARDRHSVTAAQAVLAEATGALEDALARYQEAARRWASYGHVLERGHALLGAGRCLFALGRGAEAGAPLQEARAAFAGLGARPQLAETERYLEQASALSS